MSVLYVLRAIASLNNTAIYLLKHKCYNQAMLTFSDSVSLATQANNNEDEGVVVPSFEEIQEKLQKAARRLACPEPSTKTSLRDGFLVHVMSDNEVPLLSDEPESKAASLPFLIAHVLRIEGSYETNVKLLKTLYSAIVLHNYSIAYLCLANLSSTPSPTLLLQGSLQLMQFAYRALCIAWQEQEKHPNEMPHLLVLPSQLVLRNLVSLASQLGDTVPHHQQCLETLQSSTHFLVYQHERKMVSKPAPAA